MAFRTLAFFLREVYSNLRKNPLMIAASIMTVMLLAVISGAFLLAFINMSAFKKEITAQLELTVYLKNNLSNEEISSLRSRLVGLHDITEVIFYPRDQALQKLKANVKQEDLDLSGITENPLPDSFIVRVHDPSLLSTVAKVIEGYSEVKAVSYWEKYLNKFFALVKILRLIGFVIIVLLGVATVFIINNTIRLSVFARRKEIKIMELVGAAHWFIRGPFILEGMFYGLVGSFAAIFLLRTSYTSLVLRVQEHLNFLHLVSNTDVLTQLFLGLVVTGVAVGGVGSYLSVSKFLKL